MTTSDLIDDLRSRINPAYANQLGTESYERRLCAEALEAQAEEIERLRETLQCIADADCMKTTEEPDALAARPMQRSVRRVVSEAEFAAAIRLKLLGVEAKAVVGPGRSGAVASVYASHILGIPFIPYGMRCPEHLRPLLIVDTARKSGATLRKAERQYGDGECVTVWCFDEPPRVRFWYERDAQAPNAKLTRAHKDTE